MTSRCAFRCGLVGLIGRPNVGKSTLLNRILAQKLSITSRKPQTTRHRILGIKTSADAQVIYVDTPGLHRRAHRALNRYMNRTVTGTVEDVDVAVLVLASGAWTDEDESALRLIERAEASCVVALNKIDRLSSRGALLPLIETTRERTSCDRIVPISALKGDNVERLEGVIRELLPHGQATFPDDQLTDRSTRFVVAELVREKLIERVGQELPYRSSVEVEHYHEEGDRTAIGAIIWVERQSQKGIVIGRGGLMLKAVGVQARRDIESLLGRKVNLTLWVKVKRGWSDDERALHALGYD